MVAGGRRCSYVPGEEYVCRGRRLFPQVSAVLYQVQVYTSSEIVHVDVHVDTNCTNESGRHNARYAIAGLVSQSSCLLLLEMHLSAGAMMEYEYSTTICQARAAFK